MKKFVIFSLVASCFTLQAQDLEPAKRAIDAEQFEKAKQLLKAAIQAKPSNGKSSFFLGNIYLKQNLEDSAKMVFEKGLNASENARFNHIGLAQLDLDKNKINEAKSKFDLVTKEMRKKDVEEFVYIAKAYMNNDKPNFKAALEILNKAKTINPQNPEVLLALGDAHFGDKNQNEAYSAYRAAFAADPSLIRAKMQLGVLLKGAKAYTEAEKALNEVVSSTPNYGPVYRELAETYYYWGNNEPKKYNEKIAQALKFYEKYMTLTDYSVSSRMRHADFLILAKDYKALEIEANKMKELDGINPRILRYLGYSAYENGNVDVAIKSMQDFISNDKNKIIPRDYLYLGMARLKKAVTPEGKIDNNLQALGMVDLKKCVEMEPTMANELNELGKKYYDQKLYSNAIGIFEIAVSNPNSKNFLLDNFYLGNAIYFENSKKDATPDKIALEKADVAYGNVIAASPTTQDAYLYRARVNSKLEKDDLMAKYYEDYMKVVTEKGDEEVTKQKSKFIEAYNNIGAFYANTDKSKAIEYFNKTLALDPTNNYALESIKLLK